MNITWCRLMSSDWWTSLRSLRNRWQTRFVPSRKMKFEDLNQSLKFKIWTNLNLAKQRFKFRISANFSIFKEGTKIRFCRSSVWYQFEIDCNFERHFAVQAFLLTLVISPVICCIDSVAQIRSHTHRKAGGSLVHHFDCKYNIFPEKSFPNLSLSNKARSANFFVDKILRMHFIKTSFCFINRPRLV